MAAPRTYAELRRTVETVLLTGQREIDQAKVRTYWDTGRLINEHLLLNRGRADYGADVMARLARDLKISATVLYRCAGFAVETEQQEPENYISVDTMSLGVRPHAVELITFTDDTERGGAATQGTRLFNR